MVPKPELEVLGQLDSETLAVCDKDVETHCEPEGDALPVCEEEPEALCDIEPETVAPNDAVNEAMGELLLDCDPVSVTFAVALALSLP